MVIRGSPPIWSGNRIDDVVDPGCSEGLGFRQGRYRCRAGAVGQHEPGDVDGFHGLQMRPQIDARGLDVLREPADVVQHSTLIEQQCRGREVGEAWMGGAQNQTRVRIGRMLGGLLNPVRYIDRKRGSGPHRGFAGARPQLVALLYTTGTPLTEYGADGQIPEGPRTASY